MKTKIEILKFVVSIIVLAGMTVFTGCRKAKDTTAEESTSKDTNTTLSVYVVNYPLQYFAERIGGPDVQVTFPAPADGDPAFWKPSQEQIAAYQKADLILLNGASYAKWVSHVSLPASRMVDTSVSFADTFIPLEDTTTHSHGLEGKHEHGDVAFTTWLDPQQAIAQALAVRDALIRLRPGAAGDFNQRFNSLATDLKDLNDQLTAVVTTNASRPLVFSHPVYQYLIRRYGLNGREVHWEPEESPTPEQWAELKQLLTEQPAQWMIWEGTPNPSTVEELKKIGLDSLVFDPCAGKPEKGDFMSVMKQNVAGLQKVYGRQ
ncbi:MAG: zinc ABC transporter substrate-binding protein [Planctomycetes bacterium]|nr:zinc ABC transporter substrate-binding protein [Planctomycetota bacterium]